MWLLNTLVILSVFGVILCDGDAEVNVDNGIVVLKTDTFEPFIKENEYVLVEFCKYFLDNSSIFYSENVEGARILF